MPSTITPEIGLLISDLWDTIAGSPSNISARVLLMHQYVQLGWKSEAEGIADEILRLSPRNSDARQVKYGSLSANTTQQQNTNITQNSRSHQRDQQQVKKRAKGKRGLIRAPNSEAERSAMESSFVKGIKEVQQIGHHLQVRRDVGIVPEEMDVIEPELDHVSNAVAEMAAARVARPAGRTPKRRP